MLESRSMTKHSSPRKCVSRHAVALSTEDASMSTAICVVSGLAGSITTAPENNVKRARTSVNIAYRATNSSAE
jgi:hypothetical protein